MNTLILNSNLVSPRSTSMTHGERTRRGVWISLIQFVWGLFISFRAECTVQYLLSIACNAGCGSAAVWVSEYVLCFQNGFTYFCVHVGVCASALRKRLNRQWLKHLSSENIVANSNPSPWVLRLSHSITRLHFSRHITWLQSEPGPVVWQAVGSDAAE